MILDKISNVISNKRFIFIFSITIIFLSASFYVYNYYIKPRLNRTFIENKEFIEKGKEDYNVAKLYFFYADWCPHSKKAYPKLEKFEKENEQYENILIDYKYIKEENGTEEISMFEKKYKKKIDGYPTVLLVYKDQVIEFDTEINNENLLEFFQTVF